MKLTLLQAMARQEGFYVSGTRPARNNNPGDIEFGQFALHHGATGSDGRFAIFPDPETGFAAMKALLQEHYAGLTIEEAINKWAPPHENETDVYLAHVLEWTGLPPNESVEYALQEQA